MSTSKHTPEPWVILPAEDRDGTKSLYVNGPTGDICDLYYYQISEHGQRIKILQFNNSEANARLIAASPELLAGLKLMVGWHDALRNEGAIHKWVPSPWGLDKAREALAKATAEEVPA